MQITLTPEIEHALVEEAKRQRTTPEVFALDCLRERLAHSEETQPSPKDGHSLADFLSDYIGVLASSEYLPGGARLSETSSMPPYPQTRLS
jgi:hypothetical protein